MSSQKLALIVKNTPARSPEERPRPANVHRLDARLADDEVERLVADYAGGVETRELMAKYGLSKGSVRRLLADHGVTPHHKTLTEAEVDLCVKRYVAGLTIREVGAELGIPKSTVQGALLVRRVEMRPASRRVAGR